MSNTPGLTLPHDLQDRGFILIARNDRLYAVSPQYGSTLIYTTIDAVIRGARRLIAQYERENSDARD